LFKLMTGVDLVHVPYRGAGAALPDLLGGQVQVMFGTMPSSIEYIRAGHVRALAVTTETRSDVLPDLPTVGDSVPGYEASSWYGIGAPRNTPPEIIDRLNKAINAGLADPKIKARLADLGGTMLAIARDFGKLMPAKPEVGQGRPRGQHQGSEARIVAPRRHVYRRSASRPNHFE
jgi:tripartite-type tricarboxylate transporter receptor subunit TctC